MIAREKILMKNGKGIKGSGTERSNVNSVALEEFVSLVAWQEKLIAVISQDKGAALGYLSPIS
jgi:hypothetical protein